MGDYYPAYPLTGDYYPACSLNNEDNSFYSIVQVSSIPMAYDPFVWDEPELNVLQEDPSVFTANANADSLLFSQQCAISAPSMHPNLVSTLKSIVELDDNYEAGLAGFRQEKAAGEGRPRNSRGISKLGGDHEEDDIAVVPVDLIKSQRPFKCSHDGCSKTFKNPQTLKMHQKTHRSDHEPHPAVENCSYWGGGQGPRRSAGHNKKIPSRCPVCWKTFVGLYELRRHFGRKHSEGEKMHGCENCGKRFYIAVDLRDHQKLCGEPIECKCGTKFAFRCNFVAHRKSHPQCRDNYLDC